MNLRSLLVGLVLLPLFSTHADETAPTTEASLRDIRTFISAAPKATTGADLSYKIKIPERERREAVERCNEIIARDKTSMDAYQLREELISGEGRLEAVASFHNIEEAWQKEGQRIFTVLGANLIAFHGAGSRGFSVSVSQSHATRARRLLAEIILAEHLTIGLTKSTEGGTRWVTVTPTEALKEPQ